MLFEKKATIAVNKIEFLGILIDETRIVLQDHIVKRIHNFPDVLKDKKHLQSLSKNLEKNGQLSSLITIRKLNMTVDYFTITEAQRYKAAMYL